MPPALHVQTVREEVRRDPDIGIAELERLAGVVGSGAHPLIGMSASAAGYRVRVDSALAPLVDGGYCARAVRVRVQFGLADRFIRIAREAQGDGCLHALALDHHMTHARAEDEALNEFAPRIVDRIRADLAVLEPAVGESALAAQASMKAQVEVVVERAVQMLHVALVKVKEDVDSPEELARLRESCDGRARLLSKTPA